jgi:hypothetical protein
MLTHPTLEQMASLGLNGMAAAWRALAEQDCVFRMMSGGDFRG